MNYTHYIGTYNSLDEVWAAYPSGGVEGDFFNMGGAVYGWNTNTHNWVSQQESAGQSRQTQVVYGDLDVHSNLNVGGILNARVVRGRSAFCGLFEDELALSARVPHPYVGQWALVIPAEETDNQVDNDDNAIGEVYWCQTDGVWTDAGFRGSMDGDIDAMLMERDERIAADEALDYAVITNVEMDAVLNS